VHRREVNIKIDTGEVCGIVGWAKTGFNSGNSDFVKIGNFLAS
jgi:hypothetical protein